MRFNYMQNRKNYYRLLGVTYWDIFDSKVTWPRNHLSFPKKSGSELTISLYK